MYYILLKSWTSPKMFENTQLTIVGYITTYLEYLSNIKWLIIITNSCCQSNKTDNLVSIAPKILICKQSFAYILNNIILYIIGYLYIFSEKSLILYR